MPQFEILKRIDLNPDELEEIEQVIKDARNIDGFLHIEIRRVKSAN